jgi:tetratricopeptide (TPR) repeat protein
MGFATLARANMIRYQLSGDDGALATGRSLADRAVELASDNVYANIYSGRLYYFSELYPQAAERHRAALVIAPGHPEASDRLAWSYNAEGRFDEAESALRQSIRRYPDYWYTHLELGVLYYQRDRLDNALDSWDAALRFAPNDVTTLNNIGAVHHLQNEWTLARDYFQRAFQISPTAETCANMGLSLYFMGEYGEAARYYEFALEYADTTDFQPWGNLATAQYWAAGQRNAAMKTYAIAIRHASRSLQMDPENPYIIAALVDYYTMSGRWDDGFNMITYGDSVAPNDADFLFASADAYERHGDREIALRYLRNAIHHGYSVAEIERTPSLVALTDDPLFKQMISGEQPGTTSVSSD